VTAADGTYPGVRAGETITTAAELDALPDATVVLDHDGDAWQSDEGLWSCARASLVDWGTAKLAKLAPLTVLFRPDAPEPAPVPHDAVERALRDLDTVRDDDAGSEYRDAAADRVATALHTLRLLSTGSSEGQAWPSYNEDIYDPPESAQRGGEAADREALVANLSAVAAALLRGGQDNAYRSQVALASLDYLSDAARLLAARGDAAAPARADHDTATTTTIR
jgi:hypothetical protein